MGNLTTITLYNDHIHEVENNPEQFVKNLMESFHKAYHFNRAINRYGMIVQPSKHADDSQLYLHYGNGMYNLGPYNNDMERMMNTDPELAERMLKLAALRIKEAQKRLKEIKNQKP